MALKKLRLVSVVDHRHRFNPTQRLVFRCGIETGDRIRDAFAYLLQPRIPKRHANLAMMRFAAPLLKFAHSLSRGCCHGDLVSLVVMGGLEPPTCGL